MDRVLDNARSGPLHLKRAEVAEVVREAILFRDKTLGDYRLHAYLIMANHVHFLATPNIEVTKLLHSLKRFSARAANRVLGRTGAPFWQDESYDRLVRNQV